MNSIFYLFAIIALGYLFGRIRIKGIGLGVSMVLLVALVFGHFGVSLPSIIKNLGLACFVGAVGHITGPTFFDNFRKKALSYILVGFAMVFSTGLVCAAIITLLKLPVPLSMGLFAGALSSTPCLAAAAEISGDPLASVGYGLAYPFGVVGVVLAVQLISKLVKEKYETKDKQNVKKQSEMRTGFVIDGKGMFFFSLSICLGVLLGSIEVPLQGNLHFSLGISGGVLFSGLLFGNLNGLFGIETKVNKPTLDTFREFGLVLFLAGAGVEAGQGFVKTLNEYGFILFVAGMIMTIVPILVGFLLGHYLLKLDIYSSLGSICGGMTSTPALGSLSELEGYDDVAAGYAATYSIALICMITGVQLIYILFI